MAVSPTANSLKNTMGSTPLDVAYAGSRIPIFPNYSDDEYWHEMLTRKITFTLLAIYSIIFALGLVGNGLVIFILGFYMKKTVNTIWFLNLTIANFIFTCFLPLRIAHHALKLHWPFGKAVCKLNDSIAYLNLYASAYFLAVISVERCASVRSSAWAQSHRRNWLAWLVAGGIWFLALASSSPRIQFRHAEPSPIDEEVIICFLSYGRKAKINHHLILISQYVFAFIVPISVTIVCHVKIDQGQRDGAWSAKSFKVIKEVTVIFYLCWLPYHILSFFETLYLQTSAVLTAGLPLTTGLAFASSCVNPIVYVVVGYDFSARPRPSFLSAFENVFGEERSDDVAKPETETSSQDL
ncbi:PREDICTED: chemokine-like receptor 1 [Gekko japonicus]|uniref:Chemokine-like receptor 1 n=1 Tax=Gekko japonicus TaxID=146911 RepID=A0ABM1K411_GEKJA|nr:PREDICTED: chemokine-like receptor 1 [Gekko japonicus]